jgi:hypothetical protein
MLFFVSKYVFVIGLANRLRAAERPVIVNTSVPGARPDAIDFDNLELTTGFTFVKSNAQQRRANELLGILATQDNRRLAYVSWGPGRLVRTSFTGDIGKAMKIAVAILGPLIGQSPEAAVRPIIDVIGNPLPGRAAYRGTKPVPLTSDRGDLQEAARLAEVIEREFPQIPSSVVSSRAP